MAARDVGPRSDLYSLGAVGYFLLTGSTVFEAANVIEVILHHVQDEPIPPSQRTNQSVPADLEALILRCLRKNPAERPADAAGLRRELRRLPAALEWTDDDARAWWEAFRNVREQQRRSISTTPDAPTLTVDLEARSALRGRQI